MDPDVEHYSLLISLFSFSLFGFISLPGLVFALIILIFCSGLISGSEVAFFSLDKRKLIELETEKSQASKRILQLIKKPRRLLAIILISNNFINISIVILSDLLLKQIIHQDWILNIAQSICSSLRIESFLDPTVLAAGINFFMAVVLSSFILLVFGEVLPKIYARMNSVRLAKIMALPLNVLGRIFHPLIKFLISFSSIFERRFERKNLFQNLELKKDLDKAIEITSGESQEAQEEVNFLRRVLKFNDVPVKQIMKSRVDVIALDEELNFTEVIELIKKNGYSRLPVFREDFDHVIGLLYTKDLIPYVDNNELENWHDLIKEEVFYVPDSKMINDLLKEFQARRTHLAIVVDEYGGNTGIVTLEDVMEEVIGEIKDEFDEDEEQEFYRIDENNFIFEGKTMINDFCKIMEIDQEIFEESRGESDSIAGLILEVLGSFPKNNEEIRIGGLLFSVLSVNSRRIKQVKVTKKEMTEKKSQ